MFLGLGIVVLAGMAIFWKLAFPMLTISGFYALWFIFNYLDIGLLPNLLLGLTLTFLYGLLLMKDEESIQMEEMPENWDTYHAVLCSFVALHAACLTAISFVKFSWLPTVAYVCILFASVFLAIQFMVSTYFRTDG